jgi:anti-sigma B factor antagonist
MTKPNVSMTVRSLGGGRSCVDIRGEVTAAAENALMDAYAQAASSGVRVIILNFGELEYMNSSGIGLLVTLLIRANRQRQQLLAVGLNEHYQQIFELTRLNEAIGIYNTEAEALAAAAS